VELSWDEWEVVGPTDSEDVIFVPVSVIFDRDLSAAAYVLYAGICWWHSTGETPTQADMGRQLGMSRSVVVRSLRQLRAKGLVETHRQGYGLPSHLVPTLVPTEEEMLELRNATHRRPSC
jgi:biotin operon repressor